MACIRPGGRYCRSGLGLVWLLAQSSASPSRWPDCGSAALQPAPRLRHRHSAHPTRSKYLRLYHDTSVGGQFPQDRRNGCSHVEFGYNQTCVRSRYLDRGPRGDGRCRVQSDRGHRRFRADRPDPAARGTEVRGGSSAGSRDRRVRCFASRCAGGAGRAERTRRSRDRGRDRSGQADLAVPRAALHRLGANPDHGAAADTRRVASRAHERVARDARGPRDGMALARAPRRRRCRLGAAARGTRRSAGRGRGEEAGLPDGPTRLCRAPPRRRVRPTRDLAAGAGHDGADHQLRPGCPGCRRLLRAGQVRRQPPGRRRPPQPRSDHGRHPDRTVDRTGRRVRRAR